MFFRHVICLWESAIGTQAHGNDFSCRPIDFAFLSRLSMGAVGIDADQTGCNGKELPNSTSHDDNSWSRYRLFRSMGMCKYGLPQLDFLPWLWAKTPGSRDAGTGSFRRLLHLVSLPGDCDKRPFVHHASHLRTFGELCSTRSTCQYWRAGRCGNTKCKRQIWIMLH